MKVSTCFKVESVPEIPVNRMSGQEPSELALLSVYGMHKSS